MPIRIRNENFVGWVRQSHNPTKWLKSQPMLGCDALRLTQPTGAGIRFQSCVTLIAGLLFVMPVAEAADDAALQQQMESLQQRVTELEKRLSALETPQIKEAIRKVSGPENPGHSEVAANWEFLKVGHGYTKVRELLGEPVAIKKGAMEFWFYSDKELDGPFVKFLFEKVTEWRGP